MMEEKKKPERKTYKLVENPEWENGYRVFPVTDETRELLNEIPCTPLCKASDLSEGDEVIVSFKLEDGSMVHGIAEVTYVDYSKTKAFSVFMSWKSNVPDRSYTLYKEDIKFKILRGKK